MYYLSSNKILCDDVAFMVGYEYSNAERGKIFVCQRGQERDIHYTTINKYIT